MFERETAPVSLRRAWLISRAWIPTNESPISPSISARGTSAATESTTTMSIAAGADEGLGDLECLLAGVGLADQQLVHVDPAGPGIGGIERVLDVDERRDAAALLRLGDRSRNVTPRNAGRTKSRCPSSCGSDLGVVLDPDALFDVQIKRIHEYKRQILNILEAVAVYDAIRAQPMRDWIPRVKIFAGKAAASYATAKLIIRLANDVAEIVNSDPTVRGLLKVVFLPNYNVSLAERIIPAADLSEQISTAGMEASGTGNMKFALNGALTIGTLDGANVEIREKVGAENIFIFGLTAEEVEAHRRQGIDGRPAIERSVKLAEVLDAIASGVFSPDEPDRYRGLVDMLTHNDYFLVTADFDSYFEAQRSVFRRWRDKHAWWQAAALNTAHMGWFSSDRTISEYAEEIWDVPVRPPGRG